jgi:hypothetical protein
MERILRNAGGTLTLLNYDANGALADAGNGNASVAVIDSAGATVAGSPFVGTRSSLGTYAVTLPATLGTLDQYRCTWTMPDASSRFSEFEVVGAFLFTIAELRAFDSELTNLAIDKALEVREIVEDAFHDERITISAFRLQGRREIHSGDGSDRLMLERMDPYRVAAVTVDGTTFTQANLDELVLDPTGEIIRPNAQSWSTWGVGNIRVLYEYGSQRVDADVRRAALRYARYLVKNTTIGTSDRATAVFTEAGGYRLTLAGKDGWTGLPEVDAVLKRKGKTVPGVA